MSFAFSDTIVALSSGRLPSGIAIVRISGPQSRFAVETIAGPVPEPRRAVYRSFKDAEGFPIDSGLLIWFAGQSSFTGEDCAEFQVHGGKAVVAAMLDALTGLPGIRHAEAGEFTRRAFLNGKVDLLKAEALADLVSAETEAQRRLALYNSEGAQSQLYSAWRGRLIHARAMIEAELDFADEADVPGSASGGVWSDLALLVAEMRAHIDGYRKAEIVRDGFDVVILGAPNAGKSSLLNALVRREAAIVSDEPGTTRDLIEILLDLDGIKVRLTDTAGIRPGAGRIEAIGIEKALARTREADLIIQVIDAVAGAEPVAPLPGVGRMRVGAKADLLASKAVAQGTFDHLVSTVSGEGMDGLVQALSMAARAAAATAGDVLPSRLRHVALLRQCIDQIDAALAADEQSVEIRAEHLRHAASALGKISGAVDVEELLDVIFSEFCVGK